LEPGDIIKGLVPDFRSNGDREPAGSPRLLELSNSVPLIERALVVRHDGVGRFRRLAFTSAKKKNTLYCKRSGGLHAFSSSVSAQNFCPSQNFCRRLLSRAQLFFLMLFANAVSVSFICSSVMAGLLPLSASRSQISEHVALVDIHVLPS
jgi:hypothetical protein